MRSIDLDKCLNEAIVWKWTPFKCTGCKGYPYCAVPEYGCIELQGNETPEWSNDFLIALFVYRKTAGLSGSDVNGYPTLSMLEFVMEYEDYEIDDKDAFMEYILAIHDHTKRLISEKR